MRRRALITVSSLILVVAFGCGARETEVKEPESVPVSTGSTPAVASTSEPKPVRKAAKGPDRDGDGIIDDVDACPSDPEDFDGFADDDGCPDPDNDRDGITDAHDSCPNVPGPPPDGCPKSGRQDRDGDGILDNNDRCPDDPEDKDGFQDEDGCPDPDNDRDGIPDVKDKCPNEPETMNGFQDDDGCPDVRPKP